MGHAFQSNITAHVGMYTILSDYPRGLGKDKSRESQFIATVKELADDLNGD